MKPATLLDPLPFRLGIAGRDTLGLEGVESVSYQAKGVLRLADQCVILEFDGAPATRGVTLCLRIHRRDRDLARAIASEIPLESSS